MPKHMMSLKERAMHLQLTAQSFKDYPNTAKWISHLAETILMTKLTVNEVEYALKELIEAFKMEYIGSDENAHYREQCYNEYIKLIWEMVGKGNKVSFDTFERLLPALKSSTTALSNISEIYQALVAARDLSGKRRYFGLCFMYLIFVEGLYDEDIRILHSIKKASEGSNVDYDSIKDKSIGDFKSDLDGVFFEGYNRRLRNAIAHARFSFDDHTKKMTFSDYDPRSKSEWSETLSLKEFGIKYYGKIENLCRLHSRYMVLLGVRDLALMQKPFGETTLMNNEHVKEKYRKKSLS